MSIRHMLLACKLQRKTLFSTFLEQIGKSFNFNPGGVVIMQCSQSLLNQLIECCCPALPSVWNLELSNKNDALALKMLSSGLSERRFWDKARRNLKEGADIIWQNGRDSRLLSIEKFRRDLMENKRSNSCCCRLRGAKLSSNHHFLINFI